MSDQRLQQDLAALSNPDVKTPFSSQEDTLKRLAPYHLLHASDETWKEKDCSLDDKLIKCVASAEAALEHFHKRLKVHAYTWLCLYFSQTIYAQNCVWLVAMFLGLKLQKWCIVSNFTSAFQSLRQCHSMFLQDMSSWVSLEFGCPGLCIVSRIYTHTSKNGRCIIMQKVVERLNNLLADFTYA